MGMRTEAMRLMVCWDGHRSYKRPEQEIGSMQLFLETTDTAALKALAAPGLVDGVTTTPSLIAKSGRNMLEVIAEICGIVDGPVSAEVAAMDVATSARSEEHTSE